VSVAGGVRVDEPGADLAVALALASAARGVPLAHEGRPIAAFGELGLTGELRHAPHGDRRLAEARKFGLGRVMYPGEGTGSLRAALRAALEGAAEAARAA
jgi:DNA repair protein RadA/Sms